MAETLTVFLFSLSVTVLASLLLKKKFSRSSDLTIKLSQLDDLRGRIENLKLEIKTLIPKQDANELVTILEEFANLERLEKSKFNIASLELSSLEGRLREFSDIEQELESSALETRDLVKSYQTAWDEITTKSSNIRNNLNIALEALNNLFSSDESAKLSDNIEKFLDEIISYELVVKSALDCISKLKTRFDALDIEFAELYERFGELEV
ncbi:MAG: hypothetical protein NZO16_05880 [Deltaproteobacteria bacterium]|nr:hypothetical protein [Deltaproteobacteria bacterium]